MDSYGLGTHPILTQLRQEPQQSFWSGMQMTRQELVNFKCETRHELYAQRFRCRSSQQNQGF